MQRVDSIESVAQQQTLASTAKTKQSNEPVEQQPKALRFVTNYGAPRPKRRRIGAACLTCRKRKTACSGERPYCETCNQYKLECAGYSSEATAPTPKQSHTDIGKRRSSEQRNRAKSDCKIHLDDNASVTVAASNEQNRSSSCGQFPNTCEKGSGKSTRAAGRDSLFSGPRNRMPYFRWLGPTAIMPGFKQMVVKIKRHDTADGGWRTSTDDDIRSASLHDDRDMPPIYDVTSAAVEPDGRPPLNIPFYDTSPVPPSELITHLTNTFFTHLGCNFPFLQPQRFLRDLEEKRVDPVLVDAVCALAARFSTHSLITQCSGAIGDKVSPAEFGYAFAQRARNALADTFACPSVGAAQAALLLAYNEFGEQRDSGLWMYLGIAIRLAQDLGLHKLEGLRYVGKNGPTPSMVKQEQGWGSKNVSGYAPARDQPAKSPPTSQSGSDHSSQTQERQHDAKEEASIAVEQERIDTFYAIFFLDRVVSSGTGRRSTLRDKDIEISLPSLDLTHDNTDWPAPFPALIRIVHLYGRVADLLNSIKEPSDIVADTPKRLASMEAQVTKFYQNLSPRLFFDPLNFQHYVKAGEGTNFVLLHFWFHTLIILLHQPTLLKTFDDRMLQLFPNSQQLAMSSAKTIADILSYSQLMDVKTTLGNPFTSQPIYIAACAFLKETAERTATSNAQSRPNSPNRGSCKGEEGPREASRKASISSITTTNSPSHKGLKSAADLNSQLAKHTLLATAASKHYQLCYKALESLETYWAGTKYILTVLNQKFAGIADPLLYTAEEGESSLEQPRPEPVFTSPGWRRKVSWDHNLSTNMQRVGWPTQGSGDFAGLQSDGRKTKKAFGWTLTGNMEDNSTNLAWHFAPSDFEARTGQAQPAQDSKHLRAGPLYSQHLGQPDAENLSVTEKPNRLPSTDAEHSLALSSLLDHSGRQQPSSSTMIADCQQHPPQGILPGFASNTGQSNVYRYPDSFASADLSLDFVPGNMMIESQNIDMSMLGLDTMPWFDPYSPKEMMPFFDPNSNNEDSQVRDTADNDAAGRQRQWGER